MTRILAIIFIVFLSLVTQDLFPQFKMDFGNITTEQLSNKPYLPDPGADAIILSDIGVATLDYINGFAVELERDVKMRIVNSNGFEYADIEVPLSANDDLIKYRASSFNLRNGEKVETIIPKKNFIIEEVTKYRKVLKFNFPDVHEGTVIEFSYIVRLKEESVVSLVPWVFQTNIPIVFSQLLVAYPEYFIYKTAISGNPLVVKADFKTRQQQIFGENAKIMINTFSAQNVPALSDEPFTKSLRNNQTRLSFELASVNFPNSSFEEISPTFATLTKKLLERDDFGSALTKTEFLKETAEKITDGIKDDLSKVKAVHKFVSENILWTGDEDYTSSSTLRKVFKQEKGNSADINMILIAMLRGISIKAEPVILCTRSNGTLNQYSAMLQQFNYMVANVTIGGENFLIDATNPLRPFNMLPYDCLNGKGYQISYYESEFIDLRNSERIGNHLRLVLDLHAGGTIEGNFNRRNTGYTALNIREKVRLEGEEGYSEIVKFKYPDAEMTGFDLGNITERDSDVIESCKIKIEDGVVYAGDKMLLNPFFSFKSFENPFSTPDRSFPVDFGCPIEENFSLSLTIPDQYSIEEKPDDITYLLGANGAKYIFTCTEKENRLILNSSLRIDKTAYLPDEYSKLRDFFAKMIQSQGRFIVLKKKI